MVESTVFLMGSTIVAVLKSRDSPSWVRFIYLRLYVWGIFSDNQDVTIDRDELMKELREVLERKRANDNYQTEANEVK